MKLFPLLLLTGCTLQGSLGTSENLAVQPSFGQARWSTLVGVTDNEWIHRNALAVASNGDVISASIATTAVTSSRSAVARRSHVDGSIVWSRSLAGDHVDATAIRIHGNSVLVTGIFMGTADFGGTTLSTSTAIPENMPAAADVFIASYAAADGALEWVTSLGSDYSAELLAISANDTAIYITGYFRGILDVGNGPTGNANDLQNRAGTFLIAYSHAGARLWGRTMAGTAAPTDMSILPDGDLLITGVGQAGETFGGAPLAETGTLVARFASDGTHRMSRSFGPDEMSTGHAVTPGGIVLSRQRRSGERPSAVELHNRTLVDANGEVLWTTDTPLVAGSAPVAYRSGFVVGGHAQGPHADLGFGEIGLNTTYIAAHDADGGILDARVFGEATNANNTIQSLVVAPDGSLVFAVHLRTPTDYGTGTLTPLNADPSTFAYSVALVVLDPLAELR